MRSIEREIEGIWWNLWVNHRENCWGGLRGDFGVNLGDIIKEHLWENLGEVIKEHLKGVL